MQKDWAARNIGAEGVERVLAEWIGRARPKQYPLELRPATWVVTGGRGAGKTRLGAEWVNGLVRGLPPFTLDKRKYERIALVGDTLGDVREVMIEGPSGILTISRAPRPRFEASRRRLVWDNGAVALMFSAEDPESLRGPQFDAAWCDELGCSSVDKGPNQPNVFPDPKSAENAIPHFSSGGRSDLAQQRFLGAHASYWNPADADFEEAQNPLSPVYGGRMVDVGRVYAWAWDARPFPAFPARGDRWADGSNWHCGHWLNGRLGSPDVGALINAILADHDLPLADVVHADGTLHGYVVADPTSARAALEPIVELFDLAVCEEAERLTFGRRGAQGEPPVNISELVSDGGSPVLETVRSPDHQLPVEAILAFREPFVEYQSAAVRNARFGAEGSRQQTIDFPGVLETGQGRALLDDWMRRVWVEREQVTFAIAEHRADVRPGAVMRLPGLDSDFIVTEIEDGLVRRVTARQIARTPPSPWLPSVFGPTRAQEALAGRPHALFLDLPSRSGSAAPQDKFRVAAWQKPWRSQVVLASPEDTGFGFRTAVGKPADLGVLVEPLPAGFEGRIDRVAVITVSLFDAEAASVSRLQLLNGANAAAIRSAIGVWEIVQFESAEEIEPGVWRLGGLLRGQLGTTDAMAAGASGGADFVILDDAVQPAGLRASEAGLLLNWRGIENAALTDAVLQAVTALAGVIALFGRLSAKDRIG